MIILTYEYLQKLDSLSKALPNKDFPTEINQKMALYRQDYCSRHRREDGLFRRKNRESYSKW